MEIDVFHQTCPDVGAGIDVRLVELNLVDEASFKSRIEVLGKVGGGYHDALKVLHLLKDDILQGVLHLVHCLFCFGPSYSEDCVCFIEKQDRRNFAVLHDVLYSSKSSFTVFSESPTHLLLSWDTSTMKIPLPVCGQSGKRSRSCRCLALHRIMCKTRSHALFCKASDHVVEIVFLEQDRQSLELVALCGIENNCFSAIRSGPNTWKLEMPQART